ncbi:MAG TPA: riboflavin synthase [Actinomycetota bacterium]|nr:riboflavin synthase [Actinomycetota bacterium]
MFTGIVEGSGTVAALAVAPDGSGAGLRVEAPWLAGELAVGDSVAVSGCCLTVAALTPTGFSADVVAETLRRTTLGGLSVGDRVNLERPLAVGGRLGGHLVQGHVDGVGQILERRQVGGSAGPDGTGGSEGAAGPDGTGGSGGALAAPPVNGEELRIGLDPALARYVVHKGSIAVDGVSLTVAEVGPDWFAVALVPHTLQVTTLGDRRPGDPVHLEVDVVAKYVERLVQPWSSQAGAR